MYQTPPICPDDPTATEKRVKEYEVYYGVKYAICKLINPKRAAEIGVRAGYSSWAFFQACPNMTLYGFDANTGKHGGQGGESGVFRDWALEILRHYDFNYFDLDTQKINYFQLTGLDFIHIDGDHTSEGVFHDFMISFKALAPGGYILIDDIDFIPSVKMGVDQIISSYGKLIEFIKFPSMRGEMLIRKVGNDKNLASITASYYTGAVERILRRIFKLK